MLLLPYQGEKGIHIVNLMKRYVNKILPENVKVRTDFTGKRLSSCFKIKDRTKFEHQHGEKGIHIVNLMKRYVNKILPEKVKVQAAFTGKQLSSCFKTKDRTEFEHQHDLTYHVSCSAENCSDDCIGESAR